ncbi:MAG: Alkaline phosphatase synthesis transcriptional regulatory protein PhoP [Syntrophus sp. SKADARSKE-3]|nr:Alkaline phosphatase synthesis transcriptional regulatory protein PhoP [Syntrophus sp. SKADARSKE-3]
MMHSGLKRILIIEDETHIAEGIKLNLSLQGYDVDIAADGVSGLQKWKAWQPHLVVLDIMLPGIDGFSVLQSIRLEDERLPILILSALGSSEDRVKGLSFGVDDYLAKPFNLEEFLLRVERLLARVSWTDEARREEGSGIQTIRELYVFGSNKIDFTTATAEGRMGRIMLTEQEIKLLRLFIANRGKPLSRKLLLEIGWGYTGVTTTRTVDNFMVRLRRYFEEDPQRPVYFKSLRSIGYVFDHE